MTPDSACSDHPSRLTSIQHASLLQHRVARSCGEPRPASWHLWISRCFRWTPCTEHAGWSFNKSGVKKREQDGTLSYGIPYSEHSSWDDLRACVRTLRPKRLVCAATCVPGALFATRLREVMSLTLVPREEPYMCLSRTHAHTTCMPTLPR